MGPNSARRRQVEQALLVLIDRRPCSAVAIHCGRPRATGRRRAPPDARSRPRAASGCGASRPAQGPRLRMRVPLLGRDLVERLAKELGVIDGDRRNDPASVCAITLVASTAAEPTLEQQRVGRMRRTTRSRRRLDPNTVIGASSLRARFGEHSASSVRPARAAGAAEPEALVDAHQIRRGVDVNGPARGLQLARLNAMVTLCRWCATWIAAARGVAGDRARKQPLDAPEREIDAFRISATSAPDGVDRRHRLASWVAAARLRRRHASGCGRRRRRACEHRHAASVARSSCRCSTMSTMP